MQKLISIDGSLGEGGGQVLRTSLALAALLQQPIEVYNIRANRPKPGLRPQHLTAVKAVARITAGRLSGAHENSTAIKYVPGAIRGGDYHFRIGTAGAITLLAATILPTLLFAGTPSRVVIEGGSHVPFSPVFHYMQEIFLPTLRRMGCHVSAALEKWGWYPAGGGACILWIAPCPGMQALQIGERGKLRRLNLLLALAGLPWHIVEREEKYIKEFLELKGGEHNSQLVSVPCDGQGNLLFLKGEFATGLAGFSALGKKGKPAEKVADDLCRQWLHFAASKGAVDKHLADQVLLYMALAKGVSIITSEEITGHVTTNIAIIEKFLPARFQVDPGSGTIQVSGIAYGSPQRSL